MGPTKRDIRPLSVEPTTARDEHSASDSDEALFAALTQADATEDLPRTWLALQCHLAGACRRGLLLLGPPDRGPFSVAASWPEEDPAGTRSLQSAAERALVKREGFTRLASADHGDSPTPLEGAVVAEPVQLVGALHGAVVLEVASRTESELATLSRNLRLGFGWLDALTQRRRAHGEGQRTEQLEVVLGLLASALEHDRFQGAATTFATELATELGCDRVSIGFLGRTRARVRALSHSAHFGRRTNVIRRIEACMDEALDQSSSVVFPPAGEDSPRAAHAHSELARQFGALAVCSVPFARAGEPCGAITLERSEPFDARTLVMLDVAGALAGPVLEELRREDRFIGTKVIESVRDLIARVLGANHVALKLAACAVIALVIFLAVAQGSYRVTADALLEPEVMRAAVAPFDGYIAGAPVRAGDRVTADQVLASLDNRDLQLERVRWESERAQSAKQYRQALAERDAARTEILAAAVDEARAELNRIEERLARASVLAPFDGFVVTGDLTQRLGAPVQRGEVLFEVAPLDAYRVYLMVDEADIGHVTVGQEGSMVLSSLPEDSFRFQVKTITPVSNAEEGRNTFRVEATLVEASTRLRPGIGGVAKIEIGERRLIWIWSHDLVAWLRLKLWAWTP